jgi:hypothetical protein
MLPFRTITERVALADEIGRDFAIPPRLCPALGLPDTMTEPLSVPACFRLSCFTGNEGKHSTDYGRNYGTDYNPDVLCILRANEKTQHTTRSEDDAYAPNKLNDQDAEADVPLGANLLDRFLRSLAREVDGFSI